MVFLVNPQQCSYALSDMRLKLHLPQAPTLPLFTAVIFVLHSECLLGVVRVSFWFISVIVCFRKYVHTESLATAKVFVVWYKLT